MIPGVGGLTVGGGYGWLSPKYGLAIDNLVEAEVVLSNGDIVTASESSHPDLFWAIRGAGSNFGPVTRFTFKAYPQTNTVWSGLVS
jgi:FAD/FMN-containing dehydrogenase